MAAVKADSGSVRQGTTRLNVENLDLARVEGEQWNHIFYMDC
ncbi:MAG: hypothetical protein ACRDTG_31320 [Pseudonocardiaceae bacterium]